MQSLLTAPAPLTSPQRKIFWLTAIVVAATRLFAMATSPWDWDEVQFMAGVREYNVEHHQPHPAGFPLYILLGNLVQLFGLSDFRSLQVVSFLAACSLFPLLFFIGRALRLEFRTAYLAALLFVFLPNVWYFGGTIFSDITGTAINLAAVLMLLRSCAGADGGRRTADGGRRTADGDAAAGDSAGASAADRPPSAVDRPPSAVRRPPSAIASPPSAVRRPPSAARFLTACALVGCALAVRPHGGFILLPPLLIATWYQRRHLGRIVLGALITATIAVAAYTGAALASPSVRGYIDSVRHFQKWVHEVDTIANPNRPSLLKLADEFLVRPMGAGRLSMIVTALSVVALLIAARRRHAGVWIAFFTFAPYMVFAWLMHDIAGYHRYSTAYVAVYALLAAYALELLPGVLHIGAVALLIARYIWWTYPAIDVVRSTIAPTHAACMHVLKLVPKGQRVWVDDSMAPWSAYYLVDHDVVRVPSAAAITGAGNEYYLDEGVMHEPGATVFRRERGRVAEIHPERHFECSVAPISIIWRFAEGWGDPEGHQDLNWRWMYARSVTLIPAGPGKAMLTLVLGKPGELQPEVEVHLNGKLLERFRITGPPVRKQWVVEGLPHEASRLEITTSETINPSKRGIGGDPRDLGLQLFEYRWQPLP